MRKRKGPLHPDAPLFHSDHRRPVSRREFISQGFSLGAGSVMGLSIFNLMANPRDAWAALNYTELQDLADQCSVAEANAGRIPFICFDLAGGANIAGSNVLVGQQGGQLDFLSTEGYSRMGLPGDMIPPVVNPQSNTNDFINTDLGLAFHSDSAFLRGIQASISPGTAANVTGAVIAARSDNDTGNNPHNPMYGIYTAGVRGQLMELIGSSSSVSGGNSMSPPGMIDLSIRPVKIDRPSDSTGLVDTGRLQGGDAVNVLESMANLSHLKLNQVDTKMATDAAIKDMVRCGYIKTADMVRQFGDPADLNPLLDADIVGSGGIFSTTDFDDREFQKTASVMKLVIERRAGAGTISMGGYDYHTGERATGEIRDFRAGRCMGACLEYAARRNTPLMLYVFSDGSVASNGATDDSEDGRGKGVWTGDNSGTAASFFLVYNPAGRPSIRSGQQIGWYRPDGSVETASSPAANNVNLLVETVVLNYLALHGAEGQFGDLFPGNGLGGIGGQPVSTLMDSVIAFDALGS